MIEFSRSLPQQFDQPLPEMMGHLTSPCSDRLLLPQEAEIRQLADAVAAWHFRSPLGICLRRSLLRYHFLRRADVPVSIVFGARLKREGQDRGIGGHAWLILNGVAYFERPEDYEGFVTIYVYPPIKLERSTVDS